MIFQVLDWLSIIIYPVLFVEFLLLAIFAVVDNVNRLHTHERVAFHVCLAFIFCAIGLFNPVKPIIPLEQGRYLVRVLSLCLAFIVLPSTLRNLAAILKSSR